MEALDISLLVLLILSIGIVIAMPVYEFILEPLIPACRKRITKVSLFVGFMCVWCIALLIATHV